jgi:hypothetical protein
LLAFGWPSVRTNLALIMLGVTVLSGDRSLLVGRDRAAAARETCGWLNSFATAYRLDGGVVDARLQGDTFVLDYVTCLTGIVLGKHSARVVRIGALRVISVIPAWYEGVAQQSRQVTVSQDDATLDLDFTLR